MTNNVNEFDSIDVVNSDRNHVWHHLTQHKAFEKSDPMVIVNGEGLRVWDAKGNEYLDAVSGAVWTVNVGYGRTEIADAVRDQLVKMNYFAQSAGNIPAAQFAKKLIEKMPGMSRVYYSNSGSEANEKAFKIVRQIAHKKYGGKKTKILYRERDYHGTTIGTLSATGQFERKNQYGPFVPDFVEVPHCCEYRAQEDADKENYGVWAANQIEKVILAEGPETVGAICLEPITAGGGVIEAPEGYWPRVQEICKQYDVLLHIDEVVCGLGRTGQWFGYQHYNIQPDLVTMAKGVASGYAAISCTVTTEAVFDAFKEDEDPRMGYFRDISTFGGCTAGPAAALVNMQIIEDEKLLDNVNAQGDYLQTQLNALKNKHAIIGDVRGKGLFAGFEMVKDRTTKEPVDESVVMAVAGHCMANGVIIGRTNRSFKEFNNTICLAPALIITREEIDLVIKAIDEALSAVTSSL
ncbi:aminotransferase class III-fold pyridoxal phosphate-dependent enzyme [Amphritea sp. 1_MG-2023]|uniref:aminotransferase family protein n=1 Tax=Amphritea sp. 1_MG-2023 TaxID=3062670 RepID=UPI0026E2E050|nr:aminotransferase class III-fold pyridoxal phosphate-dependent enzyme [Amphritea sp. 1_MG-2023]MDO6564338.1 aminotransferase class III-fold pyridoxal phosphate-dependent enzyme [Amphritea sp. 1_MG-2023]